MNYEITPQGKDLHPWHLAQRMVSFKRHLTTNVILNTFFGVLWYFTEGRGEPRGLPWPVWPMLGWGIGVTFHYALAYLTDGDNSVEREYYKLVEMKHKQ